MLNTATLLHRKPNADDILEELGLSRTILRRAVETGARAYRRSTKFHPRTHGGSMAWGETVGSIRQELKAQGWRLSDDGGLPKAIHKETGVTLVVTSGDKETGIDDANPSSRNSKGSASQDFVLYNHNLFDQNPSDKTKAPEHGTWVLLYYYDFTRKEVRYELSLPLEISNKGYFNRWHERFVLTPISLDETPPGGDIKKTDFNDEIDLNILKKVK